MGFNKLFVFLFCSSLIVSVSLAQQGVGFGGSIPRETTIVTQITSSLPTNMSVYAMQFHLEHFGRSVGGDGGILGLTRLVQLAITSDIVSILDSAVDKATSLSSYVASMQDVLGRASVVLNTTSVRIDLLLDAMSTCVADKRSADEDFFQAVVDNNDAQAASALDRSLVASDCVTQYRVKANALQAQYDKLAFYTNVLNKKYAYISDQEQNIVSYFAVLRPALLKNLTTIASELQSFVLTK